MKENDKLVIEEVTRKCISRLKNINFKQNNTYETYN